MTVQWWIQGRGPGGLCPPPPKPPHALLYIPNWVPKGWKNFLENRAQPVTSGSGWPGPPLSQGLDDQAPPYLKVWMTRPPPYLRVWMTRPPLISKSGSGTAVVDGDWHFDNLCGSHLQSQSESKWVDDVKLWLLTWLVNWSISLLKWPVWPASSVFW